MWNPIHRNLSIIHSESRVCRSILYIVYLSMVRHMPYVLDEFYQIQVHFVWYVFNTPLILIWIVSSLRKKFKTWEVAINRNLNILLSGKSWWYFPSALLVLKGYDIPFMFSRNSKGGLLFFIRENIPLYSLGRVGRQVYFAIKNIYI